MKLTDDVKQRKQKHLKQYRTAKQKLANKENLVRFLHRGKPQKLFWGNFWFPDSVKRVLVAGALFSLNLLFPSLDSMLCGSRAEVVSRQFLFPDSVERMLATGAQFR